MRLDDVEKICAATERDSRLDRARWWITTFLLACIAGDVSVPSHGQMMHSFFSGFSLLALGMAVLNVSMNIKSLWRELWAALTS